MSLIPGFLICTVGIIIIITLLHAHENDLGLWKVPGRHLVGAQYAASDDLAGEDSCSAPATNRMDEAGEGEPWAGTGVGWPLTGESVFAGRRERAEVAQVLGQSV